MTKEALDALDALIEWFGPDGGCGATAVHKALCALRDAEAKPVEESVEEVTSRKILRLEEELKKERSDGRGRELKLSEWRAWTWALVALESPEFARAEITRLVELGREAEAELGEWNEWAVDVTREPGLRPEEQQEEIDELVDAGRAWTDWADSLTPGDALPMAEAQVEIARLVELGRNAEGEIAGLRASLSDALAAVAKWEAWIDPLSGSSQIDAAKIAVERLVGMGRKSEDTEAKLRVCSEQFDAAMSDWGKAAELLRRIVECADEDKFLLQPPTLARAVEEAREMLRPAVPVKEPEAGELEAMLTALMGAAIPAPPPWSWSHEAGETYFLTDTGPHIFPTTPAEALAVINTRLAELAPKNWRLTVETFQGAWVVRYRTDIKPMTGQKLDMYADRILPVHGDLGARVTEALKWIADMEKPAEPAPDEPITPPEKWEELSSADGASSWVEWRNPDIGWARAYLYGEIRTRSTELLSWLPQLQARAKQVFGGAK